VAAEDLRLVAFDMEGCLTADPTVWELMHRRWGTWASHGAPYWRRFRAGEVDYDTFARLDVAAWRGAPAALLEAAARDVRLMPGAAALLARLRRRGVAAAVLSNGLLCVAERFRREFGVAHVFANRAVARDGVLTGELDLLVPYAAKGRVLADLAKRLGLERRHIAAVGDGPQDVALWRARPRTTWRRPTSAAWARSSFAAARRRAAGFSQRAAGPSGPRRRPPRRCSSRASRGWRSRWGLRTSPRRPVARRSSTPPGVGSARPA